MPNCKPETRKLMPSYFFWCLILSANMLLSACGLKGDLTLQPQTPPNNTEEATQDSEDDT